MYTPTLANTSDSSLIHVRGVGAGRGALVGSTVSDRADVTCRSTSCRPQRAKLNELTRDTIRFTVNVSREEAASPNHVLHCGESQGAKAWEEVVVMERHGGGGRGWARDDS